MPHIIVEAFARWKRGQIDTTEYSGIYRAVEEPPTRCANDSRDAYRIVNGVPLCAACVLRATRKQVKV